jgi:hypothetical protein
LCAAAGGSGDDWVVGLASGVRGVGGAVLRFKSKHFTHGGLGCDVCIGVASLKTAYQSVERRRAHMRPCFEHEVGVLLHSLQAGSLTASLLLVKMRRLACAALSWLG